MKKTNVASPSTVGLGHYEPKNHNNIPTPPVAATILERVVPLAGRRIWEPASGEGHLARALERLGAEVLCTELRDDPGVYGTGGLRFEDQPVPEGVDLVVTNPPYGRLLRSFFTRACEVAEAGMPVVLLLPQHTLNSKWIHEEGGHLLRGFYPIIFGLPHLKEEKWVAGGAFKHAWTVWQAGEGLECRFLGRPS